MQQIISDRIESERLEKIENKKPKSNSKPAY
jgi:hypothetical protein